MNNFAVAPGKNNWVRRAILFVAAISFILTLGFAQTVLAQGGANPLNLFKNYFVTGDYLVAGWVKAAPNGSGFATGTISLPDVRQPAQNGVPTVVPPGAEIVAAYLYWATVEGNGSSFAGQNGFFNGYAIAGSVLGNPNAPVSWSAGGCAGAANGSKTMRTYRADVRPYLPLDASGNIQANGQYTVRLADSGSNGNAAPFTLGASLVIIYRVLSPAVPLNSIVLYDGAFAPNNSSQSFSEAIVGFYQAAQTPIAKITHIVANGQPNKSESVQLNGAVALTSLYGAQPPFPGIYNGSWDNPTWVVNNYGAGVSFNDSSETTSVIPSASNSGCVSWGTIVFSTTVQDTDNDGLLNIWETNQGFTDVNTNEWVALPGANPNVPDIFIQVDYLNALDHSTNPATGHSHLPQKGALDTIGNAFAQHGINLHFDVGPAYQGDKYVISYPLAVPAGIAAPPAGTGGHGIAENSTVCNDAAPVYCEYPGQQVISWKTGFANIELQNFWRGRKDAYHYVLFGHSIGMPASTWSATGVAVPGTNRGTLVSISNAGTTGTVTLNTPVQNPPIQIPTNADRLTVAGAIGQFSLNGTYYPITLVSQTTANNVTTSVFTITTSGVANGTYSYSTEPQLSVVFGGPKSTSGFSDLGGADTLVTLGLWRSDDPPNCQPDPSQPLAGIQVYCNDQVGSVNVQAGTLMHELGHPLSLTHGGTYYPNGSSNQGQQINSPLGLPSYGTNCKPNYLSAMNYTFQIRGFRDGGVDYSGQTLPDLSESSLSEQLGIGVDLFTGLLPAHLTRFYAPPNAIDTKLQNTVGGRFASSHCDGTPITDGAKMVRVDAINFSSPIDWNNNATISAGILNPQDVNFNGVVGDVPPFHGFNDWANLNLAQVGARRNVGGHSGAVSGADIFGGGADIFGGGADIFGGGADIFGGGADIFGGGADIFGGGAEIDFVLANASVDPPSGLSCNNCVLTSGVLVENGKSVSLSWNPPGFGQIRSYTVWRAVGSFTTLAAVLANIDQFSNIATITSTKTPATPAFVDSSKLKNGATYTYFITDANAFKVQSAQSGSIVVKVNF